MGRKKVSLDSKLKAVEKYKRGEGSQRNIAQEFGVTKASFVQWITNYDALGFAGLATGRTLRKYSAELKAAAVDAYLRGEGSQYDICKRYGILSRTHLRKWIKVYNGDKKPRETGSQRGEIYMLKGRATTLDERIEIVSHCIANGRNYDEIIQKYKVSYSQIYNWIEKYEKNGIDGLVDKRGKHKPLDEMSETERLRAEIKMLRSENKVKEMEIAVLKKVQEIERRRG